MFDWLSPEAVRSAAPADLGLPRAVTPTELPPDGFGANLWLPRPVVVGRNAVELRWSVLARDLRQAVIHGDPLSLVVTRQV